MNTLVFATHNQHKLLEVKKLLPETIRLKSLTDISFTDEIEETADTLEGNALLKARYIYQKTGLNCFADDSGLEVASLHGAPGVYSARYAGPQKNDQDNMDKLLCELKNKENRSACFKTVIALILNGQEHVFIGQVDGEIISEKRGDQGFGYDPVFVPNGFHQTFAEMSPEEKNAISHRAEAVKKLVSFLQG